MKITDCLKNAPEAAADFLLECVSGRIECVGELEKMLADIHYLDDKEKLLSQTTGCEILSVEDYSITGYSGDDSALSVEFEMDFIMQTFADDDFVWRVQGNAAFKVELPGDTMRDWGDFDPADSKFDYRKYRDCAVVLEIDYHDVECDTL